ncbi:MAG: hypothetical protein DI565_00740 [Ancylobacter novellus]|uniref:Holin n=1 Tax=Ancylobacter novellus TaxID=921 RepID=A0A2W5KSQ1_ANCNO|nr:MAG: hypothetical protein DI565_00740 [Ancylobacter novellus]
MTKAITKPTLADAVESAVRALPADAPPSDVARRVVTDPAIAPALQPVSRLKSETLQGVFVAALAPLVLVVARKLGVPIAEGDGAIIATSLVSIVAGLWAWYGRETTTRPLA